MFGVTYEGSLAMFLSSTSPPYHHHRLRHAPEWPRELCLAHRPQLALPPGGALTTSEAMGDLINDLKTHRTRVAILESKDRAGRWETVDNTFLVYCAIWERGREGGERGRGKMRTVWNYVRSWQLLDLVFKLPVYICMCSNKEKKVLPEGKYQVGGRSRPSTSRSLRVSVLLVNYSWYKRSGYVTRSVFVGQWDQH